MTEISYRTEDGEPILVVDGEDVAPDARLDIRADAVARLMDAGVNAGLAASKPVERVGTQLASFKRVIRDAEGRITGVVEEKVLP
jgi:hypothetical protein